jgi:hypothetical protein
VPTSDRSLSRWTRAAFVAAAVGIAVAPTGASGADAAGRWKIGKPHRLKVTHTTRVKIEDGTSKLEVWQAKPQSREWPGIKAPFTAEKVVLSPTGGKEAATHTDGGLAWKWESSDPAVGTVDYVSTFEVLSADRELKTSGLEIKWSELPKDTTEILKGLPALPTANERVRTAVADIRKTGKDVIDAITGFTQWINTNIAYTPGVAYPIDDLDAICAGGGGHCGHRATVFLAFCQAAGIPARRVVGYALLNHAGGGIAVDDGNRHVWVQVHLPNLGWVEIEPAPHGSAFALGYLFVLCPLDLQSRFVNAVAKTGRRSSPVVSDSLRMEELK